MFSNLENIKLKNILNSICSFTNHTNKNIFVNKKIIFIIYKFSSMKLLLMVALQSLYDNIVSGLMQDKWLTWGILFWPPARA